ncbi:MAG: CoA pyrophosphatase [Candidatus Saccharibacteria bacterium]|nr:CoA pyrophosphatase [Pseudorhodobacter sp.]
MPSQVSRLIAALDRPAGASSDFDLNPPVTLPEGRVLRQAAVLVGLWERVGKVEVILTKRASHLKHHPGQIAFPGGKVEPFDAGPAAAAVREANEEIGLSLTNVEVLGVLPPHETVTGFAVTPVLGWIKDDFLAVRDPNEVEEVFTVPLAHVLTPDRYMIEGRVWLGQVRRYYAVPWGPYYIWGATARILHGLAERVAS